MPASSPLPLSRTTVWAALQCGQTPHPTKELRTADVTTRDRIHDRVEAEAQSAAARALIRSGHAAMAEKLKTSAAQPELLSRIAGTREGSNNWREAIQDALVDHLTVAARQVLKLPLRPALETVFDAGNLIAAVYTSEKVTEPQLQAANVIRLAVAAASGTLTFGVPPQPFRGRVMTQMRLALAGEGGAR